MNERESVDVESAYGLEVSSYSGFLMKRNTFTMEEPTTKHQIWYKWLKYKLREHMVLEAVFFLILVFLLITCYRITSQNQETQAMILNLQSQFNSFQKLTTGKNFIESKDEPENEIENENEEMKEMLEEVLKEVRMKSVTHAEPTRPSINQTMNSEGAYIPPKTTPTSSNSTLTRFNAASLIAGATIDKSRSSSSNLNPFFGFDQSSLVLVDRPEPPANKAWCTYEKEPILTVNLAKYVKPTAVSYQHSKWNGTIPDDAPKAYDVVACLDFYCETWSPLISNCEYNPYGDREQVCHIPSDAVGSPIGKLQFRFRKNHGNTERTCVSLVRVYAETEEVSEQKLRSLKDAETCSDLKHDYHNSPRIYNYIDFKNCTVLYSKGCCTECPDCCQECEIEDTNENVVFLIILLTITSPFLAFATGIIVAAICGLLFLILFGLYLFFEMIFLYFKRLCFP